MKIRLFLAAIAVLSASGAIRPGQYVVRTSGRHGLAVLEDARAVGARPVAMHPAMTFTGTAVDVQRLHGRDQVGPLAELVLHRLVVAQFHGTTVPLVMSRPAGCGIVSKGNDLC